MQFNYAYSSDSVVQNTSGATDVSFAPDTSRDPTFFRGRLRSSLEFREAISALHDVVVSDLRWHPKDRTEYLNWRKQQDEIDWAIVASQQSDVAAKLETVRKELNELRDQMASRMRPFYDAREKYFKYLYQRDYDAWFVLDPVITVHPDEVFFECFSQDESTYGRLSVDFNTFDDIGEFACGTTNIDYSAALYDEFQKIRTYKDTHLEIDPSGFDVKTSGEQAYKEIKIDLPDTWVRGFLQVSSAMALPMLTFDMHPMDVHNICFVLRRNKELVGPRSLRYVLKPGQPVKIVFDPWNRELVCPRSVYTGDGEHEIRVWGRRRLHILERLVAQAKGFKVCLLGTGMPSFYLADLGQMTYTLGLSGWTTNDWSSAGNFDLLAPRANVDLDTKKLVFESLKQNWYESPDSLATRLNLDRSVVLGALAAYTQAGRAIWDLNKNVYRARELSREPLPMEQLRFSNQRESTASELFEKNQAKIGLRDLADDGSIQISGNVKSDNRNFETTLRIDPDERIIHASCTCNWFQQNRMRKGPCEHMLALRMEHNRKSHSKLLTRIFG